MSTLITASAHKLARLFAVDFYKLSNKPRPIVDGIHPIIGSYPPVDRQSQIGAKENYFVHDGYRARLQNEHFDDTQQEDQWQLEVYSFAREICQRDQFKTVCDVGCGSAYKLT